MTNTLQDSTQNTATIIFTANVKEVSKAEENAIKNLGKNIKIKGFRPGTAPIQILRTNLNQTEITNTTIEILLKDDLKEAIIKHKLDIIGNPQVTDTKTEKGKPWEITVKIPLLPNIKLNNYKNKIKQALQNKITKGKKADRNKKLETIYQTLLDTTTFSISPLLIEKELNFSLSRLLQQIETMGVTLEQYLNSINKTIEDLKKEYTKKATENLKLEFILMQIAKENKFNTTQTEINKLIDSTADDKIKQELSHPHSQSHLKSIIIKNKVIDYLSNL